ncbi:hypothetical protein [Achromobacter sp. PAB15]|uniref:hypothetical protein n=1 Tax=Achromobacter sp. PAB15 TaxID=3233048 RepID=UPI003F912E96
MSFYTTIARLREATHSHVPGEAPDGCRVSREDLRIALHVIDRLDADLRLAGVLSNNLTLPATMASSDDCPGHQDLSVSTRGSHRASSQIDVTVPFVASVGTAGEICLLYSEGCGGKAHLSIDVGHPIAAGKVGAALNAKCMHQLVNGLMDCIAAPDREDRLYGDLP